MDRSITPVRTTWLAATLLLSCSDEHVDLGNDEAVEELGASLVSYSGNWAGYAEAYAFRDGSDQVRISLDDQGHGVLEIGASTLLAPPESSKGYPPNAAARYEEYRPDLFPGFSYLILHAAVEDKRIRLATSRAQTYKRWCELMTPVFSPANQSYFCVPGGGAFTANETECWVGDGVQVDCGLLTCLRACSCDADGCVASGTDTPDVQFDGALESDGTELVGTLVIDSARIVVRMTKS